jgi:menaquinol-cytochrome c reductase iron-sulfur subunit
MDIKEKMNRRTFMKLVTSAIGVLISAGMGIPAIAYIIGPSLSKTKENWIRLGSIVKVETGTPTLFKAKIKRQSGWITSDEEISAYVFTEDSRTYVAMSNICTHLGCRVRWVADQEQFFCPCHVGIFDKEGNVVAGPPPRPLDRYQVQVIEDDIEILAGA